ncbi:MAG: hypothetical protein MUF27_16800 [Acidobacteria bacterium]|jgi:hypothetical protein|nr:hypothetical protein [Acidobacteriota bacterium]
MKSSFAAVCPVVGEPASRPPRPAPGARSAALPAGFWRGPAGTGGEDATSGAELEGMPCPHCRERAALALPAGGGWCAACGGLVAPGGEAETICRACARPHGTAAGRGRPCAGEPEESGPVAGERLAARLRELIAERFDGMREPAAERYVAAVRAALPGTAAGPVSFVASPEPILLALPDRSLVLSTGLVRTLEDEAQLAFVLGREESLARHGWIARRYRGEVARTWSFWRRRDEGPLADAIELSCRVGFGTEAEQLADGEGLAALVAGDYDPQAGARALALLDRASRESGRFRLSKLRSHLLGRSLADAGRPPLARLNREVYCRAAGPLRDAAR